MLLSETINLPLSFCPSYIVWHRNFLFNNEMLHGVTRLWFADVEIRESGEIPVLYP